ncbi:hypothetical protein KUTeg_015894 [Tegillarca granosa]|uniref:Uncharacterized protein n=1 Tax=Tegillarca granosa TaxID=220873 RepID=A0ABQ9EJ99_TEGGR|nr:hypothetical protein KUTeg_015894 [Tegillarca granosa]
MMASGGLLPSKGYSTCGTFSTPPMNEFNSNAILECRVCDEVFGFQGDKVPRLLMCGHTVCHRCLTRLQPHGSTLSCPFDRQPTEIGDSGVWGLKKNFALLELLEKLQFTPKTNSWNRFSEECLARERQHEIPCDENETHTAVVFCTTCSTHLCVECAEVTHSMRTLAKHKRVPISEKPKESPKCSFHPEHLIEFACLEEDCKNTPLMCYICKDYGRHVKHRHTLLETEAENVRSSIVNAVQQIRSFGEEVADSARKLSSVIQQVEGSVQVLQGLDGSSTAEMIPGTAEQARLKIRHYFNELRETLNRQEVVALTTVDTHIREKLCMLRQQQEDMAILLSQVSAVCHQCESTLQQDDAKVLLAKAEVSTLMDTVKKQQQHFSEVPDQLPLDPTIPVTFTKLLYMW